MSKKKKKKKDSDWHRLVKPTPLKVMQELNKIIELAQWPKEIDIKEYNKYSQDWINKQS